jgi:hypothetical protein
MPIADLLDICDAPPDPAQAVADCQAAGARALGLYAINLSAPECVVSAEYAQAVFAGGIQVLPIITPGENPPAVSGLPDALRAWGVLNNGNWVGLDLEQPGIDTPPTLWVGDLDAALTDDGRQLLTYTNLRWEYPWGAWWAVNWNVGNRATIPVDGMAVQWSPSFVSPSGHVYDPSWMSPGLMPAQAPPSPSDGPVPSVSPSLRRASRMFVTQYVGQEHLFMIDGTGQLFHFWYQTGAQSWSPEMIAGASGLVPNALLNGDQYAQQQHLFAPLQAGGVLHAWQALGGSQWFTEKLGA